MIRTQLYIPEPLHRQLLRAAHASGQSMAQLVRGFIAQGLQQKRSKDSGGQKTCARLLALQSEGGPTDLSKNLDHYLYGGPKK